MEVARILNVLKIYLKALTVFKSTEWGPQCVFVKVGRAIIQVNLVFDHNYVNVFTSFIMPDEGVVIFLVGFTT